MGDDEKTWAEEEHQAQTRRYELSERAKREMEAVSEATARRAEEEEIQRKAEGVARYHIGPLLNSTFEVDGRRFRIVIRED